MKAVKFALAVAALALVASPMFAQERSVDLTGYVSWMDPNGDNTIVDNGEDVDFNFDSDQGFGIGLNVFWSNRISTEFTASMFSPEAAFEGDVDFGNSSLDMIPLTATLQFHFAPDSRIDPYIGAGVAYVLFDEFDNDELDELDFGAIDVDDDYGFVLNAGLSFDITPNFAILGDVRYVPIESEITASGLAPSTLEINPLIISAGASFQF
ncbi:MAG: OmpW/AlkL family protein [Thermoanaerobaculia bacterium]